MARFGRARPHRAVTVPTEVNLPSSTVTFLFDDFNGSSIDTSVWSVRDMPGDVADGQDSISAPANVRVAGGSLFIDFKLETNVVAGHTYHYTAGSIELKWYSFLYGTLTCRAKFPPLGVGIWPFIWMVGFEWQQYNQRTDSSTPGSNWPHDGWWEIDVAEFLSNHRTTVNTSLHFPVGGVVEERALPFDASTRFMVYRLDWTPTSLTWQVDAEDGVGWRVLRTVTGVAGVDIPNTPGYPGISSAVAGSGGGTPDPLTYPQVWEVDWIRVTQDATATIIDPRPLVNATSRRRATGW